MALTRTLVAATALGAALGIARAQAADPPASHLGDDALTCEQIYAEATAQSQRDQAEREKRNEARRRQAQGAATLLTGATLAGGMAGSGLAAEKGVEAYVASSVAEGAAPPARNPRLEHLKQLWAQKHCVVRK